LTEKINRFLALDIFRGATIALMVIVNTPGTWSYVYGPLRHAEWHGCTLTDLVFPFFLFIIGVAMRFSFDKYDICKYGPLFNKIIFRTITIFSIGLLLNAFPFIRQNWDWSSFRILGVLQRIALAYFFASFIVLRLDVKGLVKISFFILVGYWLLLMSYGFYSGQDPYSLKYNLILVIDSFLLGENHLYGGTGIQFDPEGLLSTIPSIVTILIGFLVGTMIKTTNDHQDNINGHADRPWWYPVREHFHRPWRRRSGLADCGRQRPWTSRDRGGVPVCGVHSRLRAGLDFCADHRSSNRRSYHSCRRDRSSVVRCDGLHHPADLVSYPANGAVDLLSALHRPAGNHLYRHV